jgi:predicted PurR-regulated permease PerM
MVPACFLDPVADRLERLGLSRLMATVVILIGFLVVLVLGFVILIPVLASQMADFASKLPEYLTRLQSLITSIDPKWLEQKFGVDANSLRDGLNSLLTSGFGLLTTVFTSIWSSGVALVSVVSLFVVTPVVAFYMLLDWDRMVAIVDSWVPRDYVQTVRAIANDINSATAGFIARQGTLCLVLGAMYARPDADRLNFRHPHRPVRRADLLHPYVGSLTGLVLPSASPSSSSGPTGPWWSAWPGVFFVGQFIEGNILQPGWSEKRRPASGVADVRVAFGAVRLCRPLIARAGCGGGRRAGAFCHCALSGIAALQGPQHRAASRCRPPAAGAQTRRLSLG